METTDRFDEFINREKEVVNLFRDNLLLESPVTRVEDGDQKQGYDRILILGSCRRVKLEIQFSDPTYWKRFHDIRLDVLSAFYFRPESPFGQARRIEPSELKQFRETINVSKRGKMYNSQADLLAYYIPHPVHLLYVLTMPALKDHLAEFRNKYGLVINKKTEEETWRSAFLLVKSDDQAILDHGTSWGLL